MSYDDSLVVFSEVTGSGQDSSGPLEQQAGLEIRIHNEEDLDGQRQ
jgi:hypothetical protein